VIGWSTPRSVHFTPADEPQCPLHGMQGGLESFWTGVEERESVVLTEVRSPNCQLVTCRCTDYAMPTPGGGGGGGGGGGVGRFIVDWDVLVSKGLDNESAFTHMLCCKPFVERQVLHRTCTVAGPYP
jgi:hypothetical protein